MPCTCSTKPARSRLCCRRHLQRQRAGRRVACVVAAAATGSPRAGHLHCPNLTFAPSATPSVVIMWLVPGQQAHSTELQAVFAASLDRVLLSHARAVFRAIAARRSPPAGTQRRPSQVVRSSSLRGLRSRRRRGHGRHVLMAARVHQTVLWRSFVHQQQPIRFAVQPQARLCKKRLVRVARGCLPMLAS
jgi:hypothetical protein